MCTLIALHRCTAGAPLLVVANRDEFLERPAEGPALHDTPAGKILAPRDLRAGGTWLGLNATGLFAAVTNRRCEVPDPARKSRGWLVMDALGEPSAAAAAERLEALPESAYNPFNLFVADAESAHLFSYADRVERFDLSPGVHVIGNIHPTREASPKLDRLRKELDRKLAEGEPTLERLSSLCRDHGGASPAEDICVHAGEYGTCSSTLLRVGSSPALLYADGAPCESPYRDLTPLLHDLGFVPESEGVQA